MIVEDYVSFETAKLLKEKGFNEPCIATYKLVTKNFEIEEVYQDWTTRWTEYVSAPTLQMTMKWLRETHKLYIVVRPYVTEEGFFSLFDVKSVKEKGIVVNIRTKTGFTTYEEACKAAIKYCLENLI